MLAAVLLTRVAGRSSRRVVLARGGALALALYEFVFLGFRHDVSRLDAHAINRASAYLGTARAALFALAPQPTDGTTFYFIHLPANVGMLNGDGPALRIWYGNASLRGAFITQYRATPGRPSLFFSADSMGHLSAVVRGLPDADLASPTPDYADAHHYLAANLARAGELEDALLEWRKVLAVFPSDLRSSTNLAHHAYRAGRYADAIRYAAVGLQSAPADDTLRAIMERAVGAEEALRRSRSEGRKRSP
jgi:tetratricopeptide (TPR) repeat protein